MSHSANFFRSLQTESAHDAYGYMVKRLTYEAAPVMQGVKPSVLVNASQARKLTPKMWPRLSAYIRRCMGLSFRLLPLKGGKLAFLLYDEAALAQTLAEAGAQSLLAQYGYDPAPVPAMLSRLAARCRELDFPHEIGLFLGYPPQDVKAFIDNCGQNCLLCGYWKVYHNERAAREQFIQIHDAKERIAYLLSTGMSCNAAIENYKEMCVV